MIAKIIKCDGSEGDITIAKPSAIEAIHRAIGAKFCDVVNLHDGRVMFVDDDGYETETIDHGAGRFEIKTLKAKKPINLKATELYWSVCRPGTKHQIVGDVAIVLDADFE